MSDFLQNVQYRLKTSSRDILVFGYRLATGLFLGLTLSLIFQEMMSYGAFSFVFVMLSVALAFLRISKGWSALMISIFNLICVLVGLLIRMYILIAPGA
jgi:hypothetical protein